jgi:predicted Zn-dependent protease
MRFQPRPAPPTRRRSMVVTGAFLALSLQTAACAVNPVTGSRRLVLISEGQEIQLGRDADVDITRSLGLYDDPALQEYVQSLGERMARESERPHLPWTFRVLDDPTVNAFALPGGYIYVTRGILTHFRSEAELVGVLGHEIGHVTARHGVVQVSRAQLAQLGLGIGTILAPDLAPFADLAGAGLSLLFLSYGRDAERQADDLGLTYMTREGYDPREMAATFQMLADASGAQDGDRIPGFLSTHPDPLERRDRILQRISVGEISGERVAREEYLGRMEGMVFGENPREGFFRDGVFFHPDMAFRLDFPSGWRTLNQKDAVQGMSPEQDAALVLTLADGSSARAARDRFLSQDGLTGSGLRDESVDGLIRSRADFTATTSDGVLRGTVLFIQHGGLVFRILGYAPQARWSAREGAVRAAVSSFRPVTDRAILDVQPMRISLVRTDRAMSLEEFDRLYPSSVPLGTVGTINHLRPGDTIPAQTLVKRVVGGAP